MNNLQMMEALLKMKNPNGYRQYMQYKQSGKTPDAVIDELMKSGKINQDMLNRARQMAQNEIPNENRGYNGPRF